MRVTESSLNEKAATFPLFEASTKTRIIKSIYLGQLGRYKIIISDYRLLLMRLIVIRFMRFFSNCRRIILKATLVAGVEMSGPK